MLIMRLVSLFPSGVSFKFAGDVTRDMIGNKYGLLNQYINHIRDDCWFNQKQHTTRYVV